MACELGMRNVYRSNSLCISIHIKCKCVYMSMYTEQRIMTRTKFLHRIADSDLHVKRTACHNPSFSGYIILVLCPLTLYQMKILSIHTGFFFTIYTVQILNWFLLFFPRTLLHRISELKFIAVHEENGFGLAKLIF